jgi:NADH-quinone oxidoreductase subunit M
MNLLDLVVALPLVGFLAALAVPRQHVRTLVLAVALITFVASIGLIAPLWSDSATGYWFENDRAWISSPAIRYHVGIDGASLWLVLLSTLLTPICVVISWRSIQERVKAFYAFLLLLEFGLIGVFVSLDLFLFYVFWEVSLVPMYFLIGVWGHERRIYAAVKFFLYTMAGSVLMLAAIIYLYLATNTFDYTEIMRRLEAGALHFEFQEQLPLFLAFFLAFAIKVPLFPLHTWLPDAHVEAPTAGSVMLASVMLKMGTYGLLRFCLPLFPSAARACADWIVVLAIIGIIYGALVAMVQPNMKKLVAYSSVSHLGFVVLGLFTFTQQGMDGAVYQMLNHGISTGALFILVGYMYERRHSLEIADYGGVATAAPWLSTAFMITMLASIGLPTLNNFVGEYLVLQGAAFENFTWAVFAAIGVILSACYMLWLYQRVFFGGVEEPDAHAAHAHGQGQGQAEDADKEPHGPASHAEPEAPVHAALPDLNGRELWGIVPLIVMMVWMGMVSQTFMPSIGTATTGILTRTEAEKEIRVQAPSVEVSRAR